ncbi:MAG: hypothetical protein WEB33_01310 [Bacteroidota bacterium]
MKTLSWNRLTASAVLAALLPLWFLAAQPKGGKVEKTDESAESKVGIPPTMAYEGFLTNRSGGPLDDGTYVVTFLLYDVPEGGTPIWTEIHQSVQVAGGYFYVVLGKESPLDVAFDKQYHLAVKIEDGPELTPRTELLSSAYSLRARYADEVPDESITDAKIKSLSWEKITGVPAGLAGNAGSNGVPANVWSLMGNRSSDPSRNFLGTTDAQDLVFRTNNMERMRITFDGFFSMGSDLLVNGSITSRISENTGAFYLADPNFGLRRLQGDNDVELFTTGGNLLFSGGNVGIGVPSPMHALDVAGSTSINGFLTVSGNGDIGNNFDVTNALTVGGNTKIGNTLSVVGPTDLQSTMSVTGGTALKDALSVEGPASVNNTLSVQGNTQIGSSLSVAQNGSFGDRLGVGVSDPSTTLHVKGTGNFRGHHIAFFESVENSSADGVAIQLSNSHTSSSNNFVTFYNGQGFVAGRIEGFDLESGDWQDPPSLPNPNLTIDPGISFNENFFTPGSLPSLSGGSLPSLSIDWAEFDFSFSKGSFPSLNRGSLPSVTSPLIFKTPSITFDLPSQNEFVDLMAWSMDNSAYGFLTLDPLAIVGNSLKIAATKIVKDEGVTYGSKGADYAEWLPKLHPEEEFKFGQVVGVFGGKISKSTRGADQILVVSIHPVVLGNQPPEGEEERYEKVAFMGQVPVAVLGKAKVGDYILSSGQEDGTAIAVSPNDLQMHQLSRIVGRAWEDSHNPVFSLVNVAVGLQDFEWVQILERQTIHLQNALLEFEEGSEKLVNLVKDLTSRIQAMEARWEQSGKQNDKSIAESSK